MFLGSNNMRVVTRDLSPRGSKRLMKPAKTNGRGNNNAISPNELIKAILYTTDRLETMDPLGAGQDACAYPTLALYYNIFYSFIYYFIFSSAMKVIKLRYHDGNNISRWEKKKN